MSINKFNSEGYYDPTAYEAMTAVEKEEKALRAFRPIVYICSPYAGGGIGEYRKCPKVQPLRRGQGVHPCSTPLAVSAVSE